jgi:Flp pilus assembly protein TadG
VIVVKQGLLAWLTSADRRIDKRDTVPGVVAYYWDGKIPTAHPVKDVNWGGAYISTDERWHVDTLLIITLQLKEEVSAAADSITLPCRVVRHGEDGIGVQFMPTNKQERQALKRFVRLVTGGGDVRARLGATKGEAVVECALIVPLVFLLIVNAFNFGAFIYCWLTVADAARAGADYACTDSNTAGGPAAPNVSAITTVVQNATSSLPNYSTSNPAVNICQNVNGTTTVFGSASSCGVTGPPSDPQPIATGSSSYYSTVVVDVSYSFTQFFAGPRFFSYALLSLPGTIHRRMVVRWP